MHDAYFGIFCAHFRHFIEKLHYKNAIKDVRAYLSKTCYYKMHILGLFCTYKSGLYLLVAYCTPRYFYRFVILSVLPSTY